MVTSHTNKSIICHSCFIWHSYCALLESKMQSCPIIKNNPSFWLSLSHRKTFISSVSFAFIFIFWFSLSFCFSFLMLIQILSQANKNISRLSLFLFFCFAFFFCFHSHTATTTTTQLFLEIVMLPEQCHIIKEWPTSSPPQPILL